MKSRAKSPSRRALLAGVSAAPVLGGASPSPVSETETALELCSRHGDIGRRTDALVLHWGRLETELATHHNWFELTQDEQNALAEAEPLRTMDVELEALDRERALLLRRLHCTPAFSGKGALGKLLVVANEIGADDHPTAHRLLLSAIADVEFILTRSAGAID